MAKIDTSEWKEFSLKDLFKVKLADGDIQAKKANEGTIPLVSSGMTKNGICKFIEPQKTSTINSAGTITVDMFGKAFYQESDYYAVSHGRINILEPLIPLSKFSALYIASIIEKTVSPSSSFTEMCSSTVLNNLKIKLPALVNGEPDLAYMESYIQNLEKKIKEALNALTVKRNAHTRIDMSEWKEFCLGELFDIEGTWVYGKDKKYKTHIKDPDKDAIAVISGTTTDNGVNYYTKDALDDSEIYQDCLTMTTRGNSGQCFYQDEKFCLANNVLAMPMLGWNRNSKLFIGTILSKLPYGDNYSNYPTKDSLAKDKISLPVTPSGDLDFDYMTEYISELEAECISKLEAYLAITRLDN